MSRVPGWLSREAGRRRKVMKPVGFVSPDTLPSESLWRRFKNRRFCVSGLDLLG